MVNEFMAQKARLLELTKKPVTADEGKGAGAIRLLGGPYSAAEYGQLTKQIEALFKSNQGTYQGLLRPIEASDDEDVEIPEIESSKLNRAIQSRAKRLQDEDKLTGWFNVVVLKGLEEGPVEDVGMLYSRKHRHAYMPQMYLQLLNEIYDELSRDQQSTFAGDINGSF
jgi:hypothetical protein